MTNNLFSIIIPTYNRADVIEASINSIKMQTYKHWELIIVDDNSTDHTRIIVEALALNEPRIKYVHNNFTHCAAGTRKTGLTHCRGEYIAYLDSDNAAINTWLEESLEIFNEDTNVNVIYPSLNFKIVDIKNGVPRILFRNSGFNEKLSIKDIWSHKFEGDPNGLVHKNTQGNVTWDEDFKIYEDYDYSLQLSIYFNNEGFFFNPLTLINYTRTYGKDGVCNNADYSQLVKHLKMLQKKYNPNKNWSAQWSDTLVKKYEINMLANLTPIQNIRKKYEK